MHNMSREPEGIFSPALKDAYPIRKMTVLAPFIANSRIGNGHRLAQLFCAVKVDMFSAR